MIINDINFVLEACCREVRACAVDSGSLSMHNRFHKVLDGVGVSDILARFIASLGTS